MTINIYCRFFVGILVFAIFEYYIYDQNHSQGNTESLKPKYRIKTINVNVVQSNITKIVASSKSDEAHRRVISVKTMPITNYTITPKDGSTNIQIFGAPLNQAHKYAVIGVNNFDPGFDEIFRPLTSDFADEYITSIGISVVGWKNLGFGSIIILTGNSSRWMHRYPFKPVFEELLNLPNCTLIMLDSDKKMAIGLAQISRLLVTNYLGEEFDNTYFITADADYLPLVEDLFNLPENYDILLTSPLVNPINPKSGFIFNESKWKEHGWLNKIHESKTGFETVQYKNILKMIKKRSLAESDTDTENNLKSNPNHQLLYNGTLAETRPVWINELLETNKNEMFLAPYPALSCIGAKRKTWQQLMNFVDCPEYKHNVREIPFHYLGRQNEPYRQIYRRVDEKSGCFKTYKQPPQSASQIFEYLLDAYSRETLEKIGSDVPGDAWYIDQKLAGMRIGQWGKRQGYERIFTYNNENPFTGDHFKRLDRTPEFRDVISEFDYVKNTVSMEFKDSHFDRHTVHLNRFWKTAALLEKVFTKEDFKLVAKFRLNYLKKNLRHRTSDLRLNSYFQTVREAKDIFKCDMNLVRTEFHPITFSGDSFPEYYKNASLFAAWKWTHKIKESRENSKHSVENRENSRIGDKNRQDNSSQMYNFSQTVPFNTFFVLPKHTENQYSTREEQ